MPSVFVLSGWNNYFNRKIKKPLENVSDYNEFITYEETSLVLNFNPNDGVIANHILGRENNPYDGTGDYFIYSEDGSTVSSRWFIIEAVRKCKGQYTLTLKRDVITDNYNSVLNSDCFIQKATLNKDDILIYNQEPISTNQIKTSEYQLKDDSKMAWIVGFIDKETPAQDIKIETNIIPDIKIDSLNDWEYYTQVNNPVTAKLNYEIEAYIKRGFLTEIDGGQTAIIKENEQVQILKSNKTEETTYTYYGDGSTSHFKIYLQNNKNSIINEFKNSDFAPIYTLFDKPSLNPSFVSYALTNLKGKIIQAGLNDYYKISFEESNYNESHYLDNTNLYNKINDEIFKNYSGYNSGDIGLKGTITANQFILKLTRLIKIDATVSIPSKTGRYGNKIAPFDIFCIPYSDDMQIQVGSSIVSSNKQLAMSLASELGKYLAGSCYDIQLLPFCPMTGYTVTESTFDINSTDSRRSTPIKEGDKTIYWIFWSTSSSGSFNIPFSISTDNKKISNQCDMYRLVSPNYSGQFEFNLAKNGGNIDYFNVDYTYLPISSYIHVNPNFNGLYGEDFNDARGLICQGDFSIMYLSDAWTNYQQQNKNFESTFNREIQNMDVQRKYERQRETLTAVTGALGAGVSAGGLIGGVAGLVTGAVTGGASLAAGLKDREISDRLYSESVSFKKDMHEMQLENIQALPNSLAKTTAYTENNKIFPILEYYTCTDEEKNIVANSISNMGMTVNAVGSPINYINNNWSYNGINDKGFFKASLLRIEDLNEDYHLLKSIAEELALGVYIKGD